MFFIWVLWPFEIILVILSQANSKVGQKWEKRPLCREGVGGASISWANYFKIMQFLPESEFTPLILASKSEFS